MRRLRGVVGSVASCAAAVIVCGGVSRAAEPKLADELRELTAASAKRLPPELRQSFEAGIAAVKATGIEKLALQVGDAAVDGELTRAEGGKVRLSDLWREAPLILTWYRGGWCPYCNLQLRSLQRQLAAIDSAGIQLAVLTPEVPEKAQQTAAANQLTLTVLHDRNNELARKYGIVFALPEPVRPFYRDQLKIASFNGSDVLELPLAATYVIDQQGTIRFAYLNADYTQRAETSDVVEAARRLVETAQ